MSQEVLILAMVSSKIFLAPSGVSLPFFTALAVTLLSESWILFMPISKASGLASIARTWKPAAAVTCATPWPISPKPTTPIFLNCDMLRAPRLAADKQCFLRDDENMIETFARVL